MEKIVAKANIWIFMFKIQMQISVLNIFMFLNGSYGGAIQMLVCKNNKVNVLTNLKIYLI